jgi:hypothetical protein
MDFLSTLCVMVAVASGITTNKAAAIWRKVVKQNVPPLLGMPYNQVRTWCVYSVALIHEGGYHPPSIPPTLPHLLIDRCINVVQQGQVSRKKTLKKPVSLCNATRTWALEHPDFREAMLSIRCGLGYKADSNLDGFVAMRCAAAMISLLDTFLSTRASNKDERCNLWDDEETYLDLRQELCASLASRSEDSIRQFKGNSFWTSVVRPLTMLGKFPHDNGVLKKLHSALGRVYAEVCLSSLVALHSITCCACLALSLTHTALVSELNGFSHSIGLV